ncbi:hypothetical protein Brms1b_000113 [Colletotrichum noveboracense]|nr:hypothetical protein Brms1b_000113 [Colletotrichum noveboracense]
MSSSRSKKSSRKGQESTREHNYEEQYASPAGTDSYYASSSTTAPTTADPGTPKQSVLKSKSIKSEGEITLQGPIEVAGSVKSGGNITFNGDFDVRDKVEAYGGIEVNGNLSCDDKVKGFGKLRVTGTCEAKELEIYGNTTIIGFLQVTDAPFLFSWSTTVIVMLTVPRCRKCKKMTLYGTLTIIGDNSGYQAEEEEKIWGAIISREEEARW